MCKHLCLTRRLTGSLSRKKTRLLHYSKKKTGLSSVVPLLFICALQCISLRVLPACHSSLTVSKQTAANHAGSEIPCRYNRRHLSQSNRLSPTPLRHTVLHSLCLACPYVIRMSVPARCAAQEPCSIRFRPISLSPSLCRAAKQTAAGRIGNLLCKTS